MPTNPMVCQWCVVTLTLLAYQWCVNGVWSPSPCLPTNGVSMVCGHPRPARLPMVCQWCVVTLTLLAYQWCVNGVWSPSPCLPTNGVSMVCGRPHPACLPMVCQWCVVALTLLAYQWCVNGVWSPSPCLPTNGVQMVCGHPHPACLPMVCQWCVVTLTLLAYQWCVNGVWSPSPCLHFLFSNRLDHLCSKVIYSLHFSRLESQLSNFSSLHDGLHSDSKMPAHHTHSCSGWPVNLHLNYFPFNNLIFFPTSVQECLVYYKPHPIPP